MITIEAVSASEAYLRVLRACCESGTPFSSSRVGPVRDLGAAALQLHGSTRFPVLVGRRLNPFFALAESWWVLRGERELEPLQRYIDSYDRFSDDGRTLHGAYGFRLRRHFGLDQIELAIARLREAPDSRRVVLQMWSVEDLSSTSRDLPCNTQIALKIRDEALDLTVFNRSNDAYLGVPYNIWVFGAVQAYLARRLDVQSGRQTHFIDSLHLYEKDVEQAQAIVDANGDSILRGLSYIAADDIAALVSDESGAVVVDDLERIQPPVAQLLMRAHAVRGDPSALAELRLPHTHLGLAAYLWIREGRAGSAMRHDEALEPYVRIRSQK